MIYQIVRRDLDWRRLWFVTAGLGMILLGFGIRPLWFPEKAVSAILGSLLMLAVLYPAFMFGGRRASLFQAALPIPARDLFVARLLSLLGVVWFPLLAVAAASRVAGPGASYFGFLSLTVAGPIATAGVLALLSIRLRELSAPPKLAFVLLAVLPVLGAVAFLAAFFAPPGIVPAVCAVTAAALLWRDFASMPKAFQVAPAEAVAERPPRRRTASVRPPWWPVCRSVFSWQPSVFLVNSVIFFANPMGGWMMAPLMLGGFVFQGWVAMRWLWALPVSRRKVLAMTLLPPLLLEAAAQAAMPAGFVRAAVFVALVLLYTSAGLAMNMGSRLRVGTRLLAWSVFVVSVGGPLTGMFVEMFHSDGTRKHFWRSYLAGLVADRLSGIPPAGLAILIAGTLIALGALYWLVQRQFDTFDFLPNVRTRVDTTGMCPGLNA